MNKNESCLLKIPKVSVGLPVFNCEKLITKRVNDILVQSFSDIEICISDNGSTDNTVNELKILANQNSRIKLNIYDNNRGVVANYDTVRCMATGKYFVWAAADDHWEPDFLYNLVTELDNWPACGIAMCATLRINKDGKKLQTVRYHDRNTPHHRTSLWIAINFLAPTHHLKSKKFNMYIYGLYRRNLLNKVFENIPNIFEYGDRFLPCIVALSSDIRYVDKVLFIKISHQGNIFYNRNPDDPISYRRTYYNYRNNPFYAMIAVFRCKTISTSRKLIVCFILLTLKLRRQLKCIFKINIKLKQILFNILKK